MNKIYRFIILLVFSFSGMVLDAQILVEDFMPPNPPTGWNNFNSLATTSPNGFWKFGGILSGGMLNTVDHTGNGSTFAWVDGSSPAGITVSLETDPLPTFGKSNFEVSLFLRSNASVTLHNTFSVDFYDGAVWHDDIIIFRGNTAGGNWQNLSAAVLGYAITGGNIKFRFNVTKNGSVPSQNDIALDDIRIDTLNFQNDAAITRIVTPSLPACGPEPNVEVELFNNGLQPLTSVDFGYTVNGFAQIGSSWTGNLAPGASTIVNIGNYPLSAPGDQYVVWCSNPNMVTDSVSGNDTATLDYKQGMNGVYIINQKGSGDFNSFSSALAEAQDKGVCGNVEFKALDTVYTEQLVITGINTTKGGLTLASLSGNRSAVVITHDPTGLSDNYVVKIDHQDNITLEDITLENPATNGFHGTVKISGSGPSSELRFINNIFRSPILNNNTFSNALVLVEESDHSNFTFTENRFRGGSMGFSTELVTPGTVLIDSLTLQGNSFENQGSSAVQVGHSQNVLIQENRMSSTSTNPSSSNAIALFDCSSASVRSNLIQGMDQWPSTGVFVDQSNNILVRNNRIYMDNINAVEGIYLSNSQFVSSAFNSVYIGAGSSGAYAFLGDNIDNASVVSNIFQNAGGSGYSTGMVNTGGSLSFLNFNNLSAPNALIGDDDGIARITLTEWRNNTGYDLNSLSVDDAFVDTANLVVCNQALYRTGINDPVSPESFDYEGDPRHTPPCIGADEFQNLIDFQNRKDLTLCLGDTVVLSQFYFETVVWNFYDTSNVFEVTSTGSFALSVKGSCGSDTVFFDVTQNDKASLQNEFLCDGAFVVLDAGVANATYIWNNGLNTQFIPVSSPGVYSVTVTDSVGCVSSDSSIVSLAAGVSLPDNPTFCEDDGSLLLSANIAGTYVWSTGDVTPSIVVTQTGVYYVTVTENNTGCVSVDSAVVVEVFNPIANFTAEQATDTLTRWHYFFNDISQHSVFRRWDFGDGNSRLNVKSPIHVYDTTYVDTTYYVTLEVSNQCNAATIVKSISLIATGLEEIPSISYFNLFPVPSTGMVTLDLGIDQQSELKVRLFDINSHLVFEQRMGSIFGRNQYTFDFSHLSKGMYILNAVVDGETVSQPIILK